MGIRSLTFVHDNAWGDDDPKNTEPIVCVYQQYDGYFDGVGEELKKFLSGAQMVNGIPVGSTARVFNGAGDLAARLITFLKDGDPENAGGVYIENADAADDDMGAEYAYHIYPSVGDEPYIRAVANYSGTVIEGFASQIVLAETYDEDDD